MALLIFFVGFPLFIFLPFKTNSFLSEKIIQKAKKFLEEDFKPITDVRASKNYRMEVAKNLLEKCFLEVKQKKTIRVVT